MKPLTVYKASAGTGKTFTLAARYIALLLQGQPASSILAVTFTNKATAEMKQRILGNLYAMGYALPEADGLLAVARQFLPPPTPDRPYADTDFLRQEARRALHDILLDFDHFTICTIDSFLQMLLAGLAHDLNLSANYRVELNDRQVIDEAVDRLIGRLQADGQLLPRIRQFIKERMSDEQGWDVRRLLKQLGRELTKETYLRHGADLKEVMKERDNWMGWFKDTLDKDAAETDARRRLLRLVERFEESFDETLVKYAADVQSFVRNKRDSLDERLNKEDDYYRAPGARLARYMDEPEAWAKKKPGAAAQAEQWAQMLKEMVGAAQVCQRLRNSRLLTARRLNELGLLDAIDEEVGRLNRENDSFLLAQTPMKLSAVLHTGDAAFVLEHTGIRYRHIMIDEFQDTSSLQWDNFRPLVEEMVDSGGTALLVGDVKQSIYRWRGGDWDILGSIDQPAPDRLGRYFADGAAETVPLERNFRSREQVVAFNLKFFERASQLLGQQVPSLLPPDAFTDEQRYQKALESLKRRGITPEAIHELYHTQGFDAQEPDMGPFCREKDGAGHVKVQLFPVGGSTTERAAADNAILQNLFETLLSLHEKGVAYSDMAILVRSHKLTPPILDYLETHWEDYVELGYRHKPQIVSAEAFLLRASTSVQMMICALRYLADRTDDVALAYLLRHYRHDVLGEALTDWTDVTDTLRPADARRWLPEFFSRLPELSVLPLYELLERLERMLRYHPTSGRKMLNDDAYVAALMDETLHFLDDNPSDLRLFLQAWEELGEKSIPTADSIEGVRVLSIHKAKGLQYHTVFLPQCDWDLEKDRNDDLLWCAPHEEPYDRLPLVPITPSKRAVNSIYQEDYQQEHFRRRIDNLNLLYVAFTRAENNLYVWSKVARPTAKKDEGAPLPMATVGQLIALTLDMDQKVMACPAPEDEDEEPPMLIYTVGTPVVQSAASEDATPTDNRLKMPTQGLTLRPVRCSGRVEFRQSNQSAEFLKSLEGDEAEDRHQYIKQGNLLHKIYSEINTPADTESVLRSFRIQGWIDTEAKLEHLRRLIERGWTNAEVASWFDGSWTLFRECSILSRTPEGRVITRRPDRVMTRKGQTVVVDFKFGRQQPEHRQQVGQYVDLLRRMGHQEVRGHLWYVYENHIVAVTGAPDEKAPEATPTLF